MRGRYSRWPAQPPNEGEVSPLFRSLFFDTAGEIVINSSAPGQVSVTRGKLGNQSELRRRAVLCGVALHEFPDTLTLGKER